MAGEKFTNEDRKLVLAELERIQQAQLIPLKATKKLLTDKNGMLYFLFGGKGDWHGLRPNAIAELKKYSKEGALIIAKKYNSKIDICIGPLSIFINNLDKLVQTAKGDLHFHTIHSEDGMYLFQVPELFLNLVSEIKLPGYKRDLRRLEEISKIINIEIDSKIELTHSDLQAKLILIGSYLGYRTYTPDKSKNSVFGILGDLCTEEKIPEGAIPQMHVETVKYIDVIWFDEEGFPTHGFEVEHTTDITKGLLRLYQVHKLRIKMFVISEEENKNKFKKEVQKSPFSKIREEYIFRNYEELDEFFQSVKTFTSIQQKFFKKS